jgi:hypothetical protein
MVSGSIGKSLICFKDARLCNRPRSNRDSSQRSPGKHQRLPPITVSIDRCFPRSLFPRSLFPRSLFPRSLFPSLPDNSDRRPRTSSDRRGGKYLKLTSTLAASRFASSNYSIGIPDPAGILCPIIGGDIPRVARFHHITMHPDRIGSQSIKHLRVLLGNISSLRKLVIQIEE